MKNLFSSLLLIAAVLAGGCCNAKNSSVPFRQVWRTEKPFTLTCGDYSITTGKRFNGKVAGLAFAGRELLVTAGSTQLGTLYEAPFPKDKFAQYTITVDGEVPAFVDGDIVGKKFKVAVVGTAADLDFSANYISINKRRDFAIYRYSVLSKLLFGERCFVERPQLGGSGSDQKLPARKRQSGNFAVKTFAGGYSIIAASKRKGLFGTPHLPERH